MNQISKLILFEVKSKQRVFVITVVASFAISSVLSLSYSSTFHSLDIPKNGLSLLDCCLYYFKGIEPYTPSPTTKFEIPFEWMTPFICISALIAYSLASVPSGFEHQIILKSGGRTKRWASMCVCALKIVIAYYAVCFLVGISTCAYLGATEVGVSSSCSERLIGFALGADSFSPGMLATLMTPCTLAITLACMQLTASLMVGPVVGFGLTIVYLTVSAYSNSVFFLADRSMILRSALVDGTSLNPAVVLVAYMFIAIACTMIGVAISNAKNYMS